MTVLFLSIFTLAEYPMDWIERLHRRGWAIG